MTERPLAQIVGETLAERQLTLATSESITGGQLGAIITSVPGASPVLPGRRGGLRHRAESAHRWRQPLSVLKSHGVISEQTAIGGW